MREAMAVHVMISKSRLPGSGMDVALRVRDHVVPLLQGQPGFRGYCVFVAEQGDAACSVGIFDDRESAREADSRIRDWTGVHMRDLVAGEPEVLGGEAAFHAVSEPQEQQKDRHQALFAVIRHYQGLPGQTETMHSLVSGHTLPAITQAQGFRGFYAFRDEEDPNQAISFTLFDGRENAVGAHEEVLSIMREQLGELAYQEPEVVMGETVVLVAA
jgi:hypothetical protein